MQGIFLKTNSIRRLHFSIPVCNHNLEFEIHSTIFKVQVDLLDLAKVSKISCQFPNKKLLNFLFCQFFFSLFSPRFFSEVSPSSYLGGTEGLAGNSNLNMRFVILQVRNPLLCTVSRGPLYVIAHSPGPWD